MPKTKSNIQKFLDQSDAAKASEVEKAIAAPSRPLTKSQRQKWETVRKKLKSAHRKRGRPTVGSGSKTIALSMEKRLLAQADRRAKKEGISRSELVALGLKVILANNGLRIGTR